MQAAANWTLRFPGLAALDPADRRQLESASRAVTLPAGSTVFGPGIAPQAYLLLLEGDIKVSQTSDSGREIVLYRVLPGQSCAMTTACLLGGEDYSADGVTETEVQAIAIPRAAFDDLIARSDAFRRFVFTAFSRRVTDLFKLVDEIGFQRLDVRLALRLLTLADAGGEIAMTHQQLATELGTAREVVSRQLNEFQRRGWVTSARGSLRLVDRAALNKLAHPN